MRHGAARGFTLVEIAIVLVIIGLLLGGILKSHELITGARVHRLISQQEGIRAAFFAFQDRFGALPGDYAQALATIAGVTQNGNGSGRVESATVPNEAVLAWEHLSRAGLLTRTYTYGATESTATSPANPYGIYLQLVFDGMYGPGTTAAPSPLRHNLKTGSRIPVDIIVEVDRKIDDGLPYGGQFQFSAYQGNAPAAPAAANCVIAASGGNPASWRVTSGESNCGAASTL
ncbi:MAG: prepilin-type N-terminal cleavage/methylation domain-containing protein [Burkholderiales bacterium]